MTQQTGPAKQFADFEVVDDSNPASDAGFKAVTDNEPASDAGSSVGGSKPLDQKQIDEMVAAHQSPLGFNQEKADKEIDEKVESELKREAERRERTEKVKKKFQLDQLKQSEEIRQSAHLFLMDMAGAERFRKTYKPTPWIELEFISPTAESTQEIVQQNVRDLIMARIPFADEAKFYQPYRLAACLKSFRFSDPQSKRVVMAYDIQASEPDVLKFDFSDDDYLAGADTEIRRKSLYLRDHVLKNSTTYQIVVNCHMEFDQLIHNLLFLSQEDPDFFLGCLTEDS